MKGVSPNNKKLTATKRKEQTTIGKTVKRASYDKKSPAKPEKPEANKPEGETSEKPTKQHRAEKILSQMSEEERNIETINLIEKTIRRENDRRREPYIEINTSSNKKITHKESQRKKEFENIQKLGRFIKMLSTCSEENKLLLEESGLKDFDMRPLRA